MNAHIEAWLNGTRDYMAGTALYKKYGPSGFMHEVLAMGETDFNRHKLLEALLALNKADVKPLPAEAKKTIVTDAEYTQLPDDVKALVAAAKEKYQDAGLLYGKLMALVNRALEINHPQERKDFLLKNKSGHLANMILDIDDEITDLFQEIDHFKKTGQRLPKRESVPDDISLSDLRRSQLNLRSRISKAKKGGKLEKVVELEGILAEVERRINGLV